jgi:hypothetical protein
MFALLPCCDFQPSKTWIKIQVFWVLKPCQLSSWTSWPWRWRSCYFSSKWWWLFTSTINKKTWLFSSSTVRT